MEVPDRRPGQTRLKKTTLGSRRAQRVLFANAEFRAFFCCRGGLIDVSSSCARSFVQGQSNQRVEISYDVEL
jgi:hypothetical protein